VLVSGVHNIEKEPKGEDAHSQMPNCLAVADGVGGWRKGGVDPSEFSNQLCDFIKSLAAKNPDDYLLFPRDLLRDAVGLTTKQGTATCLIATLDLHKPVLRTVNLGDSGYMLLRPTSDSQLEMVFRSKEQHHGWNFPFQLGAQGLADCPSK